MAAALAAAGAGEDADPSHDREALFRANHARLFDEVETDAERCSDTLVAEVERLPAAALASSPAWIDEPTLGDEVAMYGVTHSLTHLFDPLFARGEADDAVRAQRRLLDALPDGATRSSGPAPFTTSVASTPGSAATTRLWRCSSRRRR